MSTVEVPNQLPVPNEVEAPIVAKNIENSNEIVEQANKTNPSSTEVKVQGQRGGKKLKKVAVLLKKAAEKLPALSDINSKVLKSKVKTAKKKLLKASAKAKKASKKVMKAGNNNSRRNSRKSKSSRK